MKFNYYYNEIAISKVNFEDQVHENWKDDLDEIGNYSYGYYKAIERD